jgi:glutaredoxin
MSAAPQLIIYTLEHCPNCELLKTYLKEKEAAFVEEDMSTAESLTELRLNGVFVNEAPVLRKDEIFLTSRELLHAGEVNEKNVSLLLSGD